MVIAVCAETLEWVECEQAKTTPLVSLTQPLPKYLLHHGDFLEEKEINMKLPSSITSYQRVWDVSLNTFI